MKSVIVLVLGLVVSFSVQASTGSRKVVSVVPVSSAVSTSSLASDFALAGKYVDCCNGFEFDFDATGHVTNTFTVTLDDATKFDVTFGDALLLGEGGAYLTQSPLKGFQSSCNYHSTLKVVPSADASKIDVTLTLPTSVSGDQCNTDTIDFPFHAHKIVQ